MVDKQELVAILERLIRAEGSEADMDELVHRLNNDYKMADASKYLSHPPDGVTRTAEEIADIILNYEPVTLPASSVR